MSFFSKLLSLQNRLTLKREKNTTKFILYHVERQAEHHEITHCISATFTLWEFFKTEKLTPSLDKKGRLTMLIMGEKELTGFRK